MAATPASTTGTHDIPRQRALAALSEATARLGPAASAVFVREPLVDAHCPDTADLDLLAFADVDDLLPERLFLAGGGDGAPPVDVIWLPAASLDDPVAFAAKGVLPHRLLTSRLVHDRDGRAAPWAARVEEAMDAPAVQGKRIAGILDLGFLTVREVGITWDFPALALFWLHMAWAACLAALADAARILCPNVYTRPLDYAPDLEAASGLRLAAPFVGALRLDREPRELVPALRRVHDVVTRRFPEPAWPAGAKSSTRSEYRYFGSRAEMEFRIRAAEEMSRRGRPASGVFYLRLLAYALSRIPSVHADSGRGETPAFLRPPRPVRPELEELCPEILADLSFLLGGPEPLDRAAVRQALDRLTRLRRQVLDFVRSRDIVLPAMRDWVPWEADRAQEEMTSAKD